VCRISERLQVVLDGVWHWPGERVESATSSTGATSSPESATPAAASVS